MASSLVVVLAACTAGVPLSTPTPTAGASTSAEQAGSPAPAQPLECDETAYPCAFADVPDAVLAETERLVAAAIDRIDHGSTNAEIAAWLDSETLVAEVESDEDAVRFRPSGGRAVWITRTPGSSTDLAAARQFASGGSVFDVGASGGVNASVTGPGRPQRQALVLSPYRWDFGDSDDGQAVADRLEDVPDYANGVTYAENATPDSTDVSADEFKGWDDMQVVHVVSHGARLCRAGKCRAIVAAHALPGGVADVFLSTTRGLDLELEIRPTAPRFNAVLGADFFRDQYPGGLADAVVFLNGCSTFGAGATDLADAIRGSGSVVLGWDRTVDSSAAHAASLAMYDELAGNGRPVNPSLEQIGDLATDSLLNSTLTSSGRALGGDLRIREVVDFEATDNGAALVAGATVPLVGTPDDGVPDSVRWRVQVDGIEAPLAPSTGVQVTIDGHAAAPASVATGAVDANDSWELSGTLDFGVDISTPHAALFDVTITLPEGGTSVDSVPVMLVAEADATPEILAPMGTVARGTVTERSEVVPGVDRVVEAELTFTLSPGAGPRYFEYDVSGGTMTMSQSGTTPDGTCTHAFGPAEFELDDESVTGGFTIDTGTSPPTFSGSVSVTGPEIEVKQTCTGEYAYLTGTYGTRASAVFIQVFSSEQPAVPVVDRRVSGSSLYGVRTFDISASE